MFDKDKPGLLCVEGLAVDKFSQALNYCFLLLKYRGRSSFEIISRLKDKGCSKPTAEKVLAYLKTHNYINDSEFSRSFAGWCLQKGWGPRKIDFRLKELGIDAKLRKAALASRSSYQDKIKEIIAKKVLSDTKDGRINCPKLKAKIIRHLAARGFDYQDIYQQLISYEDK